MAGVVMNWKYALPCLRKRSAIFRASTTRLRQAKLEHNACVEDIDYRAPRGLDKALVLQLAAGFTMD
jgi:hypothetical protein